MTRGSLRIRLRFSDEALLEISEAIVFTAGEPHWLADFSKSLGRFKMLDLLAIIIEVGILAIFGYGIWKLVSEMP